VLKRVAAIFTELATPEQAIPYSTASTSDSDADDAKHDEPPAKKSRRSVQQEHGTSVLQGKASATGKKPRALHFRDVATVESLKQIHGDSDKDAIAGAVSVVNYFGSRKETRAQTEEALLKPGAASKLFSKHMAKKFQKVCLNLPQLHSNSPSEIFWPCVLMHAGLRFPRESRKLCATL
jgi:hypothetical protein